MTFKEETAINAAIRRVCEIRDSTRQQQLATYVQFITTDKLTDAEREQFKLQSSDSQGIGWEAASMLPAERLQALYEQDDYGDAWDCLVGDSEIQEYYENDEGSIRAYGEVLDILYEEAGRA